MSIQADKKTLERIYGKEPRKNDALATRVAPWLTGKERLDALKRAIVAKRYSK